MSSDKITSALVKSLRDKTGAGMMECKKALVECQGDEEKAVEYLRKKGLADASKKGSRVTSEGSIGSYIHMGGKVGVLVEINCETDFVARTEHFQELLKDIAMQIAACAPLYVRSEDVPAVVLEKERDIAREQAIAEGKPEKVLDKIVEGRLNKYFQEFCLLNQAFIKDDKKTIDTLIKDVIAKTGENIQVRRFTRYLLGEGLEKRQDDLAAEVAKAVQS